MRGEKAHAATEGIREMLMECQSRGPAGVDRSYFKFLLIRFDTHAAIVPGCDMTPVRKIDPNEIELLGDGTKTNITEAIQLTVDRLRLYMQELQDHPERAEHPLPLVILFSDGQHNEKLDPPPQQIAAELKQLNLDGEPVVIAAAGVSLGDDRADEETLKGIASLGCYMPIENTQQLSEFLSSVGSSGASRAQDIARIIQQQADV
jgi:uncharacterized protein YegL